MNRTTTAVILTAATLLATACSSNDNPNSPASKSKDAAEVIYAYQLGKADPDDFQGVEPSVLAEEGHRICSMLADGQSVDDAIARERLGFSDKETGAMIGAAPVLCPAQKTKVDAWAATQFEAAGRFTARPVSAKASARRLRGMTGIEVATAELEQLQADLAAGDWVPTEPERTAAAAVIRATGEPVDVILEGFRVAGPDLAPPGGRLAPVLMRCAATLRPASISHSDDGLKLCEQLGSLLYATLATPAGGIG